jgi:putative SOS response-associated peptidase YedK
MSADNKFADQVHDRMPVFLQPEHFAAWPDGSPGLDLLKPASEELLSGLAGVERRQPRRQ